MSGRWGDKVVFFPGEPEGGAQRLGRYADALRRHHPMDLATKAARKLTARVAPGLLPFPRYLHIEVTNRCNMRCVMCPREKMERPVGDMGEELFGRIVDQAEGHASILEGVALMGLGEPLLHPNFIELAEMAHSAGLEHLYTSTNAALLTGEYSERLLEADALERIIFSLDGVTAETYEAIRKGGNFAQVIGNIDGFLRAKAEAGLTRPRATIQILVMNRTEEQLDRFLEAWVPKLGPTDDILIKEVDTFGGQVEDMRVEDRTPEKRFACRQLFKDMSISWDGMVTVCCKDVLYLLTVGDAIEQDLEEIWRSREWERIRRLHREGRWNELQPCDNCSEWYL